MVFCIGGKSKGQAKSGVYALEFGSCVWHPVEVTDGGGCTYVIDRNARRYWVLLTLLANNRVLFGCSSSGAGRLATVQSGACAGSNASMEGYVRDVPVMNVTQSWGGCLERAHVFAFGGRLRLQSRSSAVESRYLSRKTFSLAILLLKKTNP
jgi:hypothetical protein